MHIILLDWPFKFGFVQSSATQTMSTQVNNVKKGVMCPVCEKSTETIINVQNHLESASISRHVHKPSRLKSMVVQLGPVFTRF